MNLKKNNVFDTTTDNKTYNVCSFKQSGECCIKCRNRHRRTWYHIRETEGKIKTKYPSWKMVSKNRKQWMKKPLKTKVNTNFNRKLVEITW